MYLSTILPTLLLTFFLPSHALKIATSLQWIEHTPQAYAIAHFYNGSTPATLVSGGVANLATDSSIDLAANAETQGLKQYAKHKDIRLIYIITEVAYRLVARVDAGVKSLADLKGKKIGTIPGTSASIFVQRMLSSAGVSPSQYTLVSGGVCMRAPCAATTLPAMLAARKIDAFGVWEPAVELGIQLVGREKVVVFQNATLYRELFSLYTTTAHLSSPTRSLAITSFLDALTAALAVFSSTSTPNTPSPSNTSDDIYSYVATRVGADPAVVQAVWPVHKWTRAGAWRNADVLDMMVEEEKALAGEEDRKPMGRGEVEGLLDGRFVGGVR